jgi:hypothetical protein
MIQYTSDFKALKSLILTPDSGRYSHGGALCTISGGAKCTISVTSDYRRKNQ